ncbi:MAG TPA: M4 family metallopeptidase [Myxococcaceae bacterium]|nr:M4 family metallopeptidase [Myxococcaceae bacterium]
MSSVSAPTQSVTQTLTPQPPIQKPDLASPPPAKVAPLPPQTSFDGQTRRPSGEKLGQAVAGPSVPLPSLDLGNSPRPGPVSLQTSAGQQFVKDAGDAVAAQQQSVAPTGAGFVPRSVERDELGMTHVRMDRTQNGVPVFGEQEIVHFGADGKVRDVTGRPSTIPADLGKDQPRLSADEAVKAAQQAYGKPTDVPPSAQRVIAKGPDGQYRDAYLVGTQRMTDRAAAPEKMQYLVDANTGEVIKNWNAVGGDGLREAKARRGQQGQGGAPQSPPADPSPGTPAAGQGDDQSLYNGVVDLKTTRNRDGTYSLNDTTRGQGVETRDAHNAPDGSRATPIKDNNDKWGEATDPQRNAAAVDAHYGAEMMYDMLKNMYGRDSIDGKGEKLVSNVHVDNNMVNAFWDGTQMNYGDGDGQNSSVLTALDVAGHEITHGLTERTSGLIYSGESGGLNEAMSDILGGFGLEYYAGKNNPYVKDHTDPFKIGEQIWTPNDGNNGPNGDALRYMDDPTKDGYSIDNYSKYADSDQEVHQTSGIANNAFSLLVKGGTNRTSGMKVDGGIGADKALQIFYRANTKYMTPSSTFADCREACLKAASDLYGADSAEAAKVKQSWSAVGVN